MARFQTGLGLRRRIPASASARLWAMIRWIPLLALTACHAAKAPSAPAPARSAAPDTALQAAVRVWKTLPPSDRQARLGAASLALLGRPYLLGPLGEGDTTLGEGKPRFRMDAFDCVTFLETSLALATAPTEDALLATMDSIRYDHGQVAWRHRNHFFEGEWLPRNARIARLVESPDDTVEHRRLARADFYAKHGVTVSDTTVAIRMVPRAKAIERWSKPSDSTRIRGLGLIGKVEGFPVLHTAFLVERKGQPALIRHASQAGTVREQPISEYLQEKKKFVGLMVWEWLP